MAQQRHDITRASQRHNCTKRARPRSKTFGRNRNADVLLSNVHELAYWCQWRLAIRGACAEFDAAGEVEVEAWSRGRREEIGIAAQAKLCSEVRHLEAQLGRLASTNAKLDAALLEKGEELLKLQEDSISFSTEIVRLKAQLAREKESSAASIKQLRNQLTQAESTRLALQTRLREVENAKQKAEEMSRSLANQRSTLEGGLEKARQRTADLEVESQADTARAEAAKSDLAALREKYSVLKRRMAEAARKVESLRAERDSFKRTLAALEDKLADVEKFQMSERGRALDRMEQELAEEKMARVELEADRDDLQTQLAAALQNTARTQ